MMAKGSSSSSYVGSKSGWKAGNLKVACGLELELDSCDAEAMAMIGTGWWFDRGVAQCVDHFMGG